MTVELTMSTLSQSSKTWIITHELCLMPVGQKSSCILHMTCMTGMQSHMQCIVCRMLLQIITILVLPSGIKCCDEAEIVNFQGHDIIQHK